MFKWNKKKTKATNSLQEDIESGNKTIAQLQEQVNLKHLENQVNRETHEARDHGNLVDLRNTWGRVILVVLVATILFNFFLVMKVGNGDWNFDKHAAFLNVVAAQNLAQIVGLVAIVLKALFKDSK